ncbi:hypothetical protein Hanom_Chr07g00585601 [Helianthus anomalus]
MILAACTSRKTQGATVRCIKRLGYKRRAPQAKKAQKNPKKRGFSGLLVITLRR